MSQTRKSPATIPSTLAPVTSVKLSQAASDTDIPYTMSDEEVRNVNLSLRYKRPRSDSSPVKNQFEDFKDEILLMLTTWKQDQEIQISKFMSEQKASLSKLMSEITELRLQNIKIQKSNTEIEKSIIFISGQYEDVLKQVNTLSKDTQQFGNNLQILESKTQDLQQFSRSSAIEIRNVTQNEGESSADLTEIVTKVGSVFGMAITKGHIRDIYRLPGKPGTNKPIVTEFSNVQTKQQLLTHAKDFNRRHSKEDRLNSRKIGLAGDLRPIYVADYLPLTSRKLFFATREFAKTNEYKFCWTTNGQIFLRKDEGAKQILIKSEQSLRDIPVPQ
ncbi:unnamed protein product [Spodoptera littoralis]|uniref:FP protein C-terminal domain-containing protein n=1 Tax=Spodoptera littoralis TaxID=7109 RepID=A0A9P0HUM3_SPOLI|nr:unnamed protein product [Spodoptera littoralis]CAH1634794.1 unnamed protein product [Spodoptera littoralis]